MELTKDQLLQIDNYIYVCGIKFYDVRTEIVDHFANVLEQKLDKNPDLDFKQEIIKIHRNFSDRGFSKLLKEKTKSVEKKFYKASLKHLITFFKLPKIIISGAFFYTLYLIMNLFEDKEVFFILILGFGFLLVFLVLFRTYLNNKQGKKTFLTLDMNTSFLQVFNFCIICFNSINQFRTNSGFLNETHNNIHLAVFVIILLFYWSGEYVYRQNKKLVREQYPNVIV